MKTEKNAKSLVADAHSSVEKPKLYDVNYDNISQIVNKILKSGTTKTIIDAEELEELGISSLAPTFSEMVVSYMDRKSLKNVDVYKAAHLDRRLFSKILSNRNYQPSKETVIHLCIALHLSLKEAEKLMSTAGFAFSHSRLSNVVIEHFLKAQNYNLDELYEVFDSLGINDEP